MRTAELSIYNQQKLSSMWLRGGKRYSDVRGAQIRCETRCRDSCWRKEDVPFREAEVVELGLIHARQCTIR